MHTFNILAPVFLLVFLGWVLRRTGFMSQEFARGMTKLAFYVALPCLLFAKISPPPEVGGQAAAGRISLVVLGVMFACVAAGFVASRLLAIKGRSVGALLQASFRGNLAYVGLPVALYTLEGTGVSDLLGWERTAALALAPVIPCYNILAVLVLLAGRGSFSAGAVGRLVGKALSNPLVVACAVGAVFSYGRIPTPTFVFRGVASLGQMGMPLALLSIGATLTRTGIARSGSSALVAALLKVAWAPVAGLLLAQALGLGPEETRIALIFCACPTAVASYIMAAHYESDQELAAGAVMISTLLSAVSLALVIAFV